MANSQGMATAKQYRKIRPIGPVKKKRKRKMVRHMVPGEAQIIRRYS